MQRLEKLNYIEAQKKQKINQDNNSNNNNNNILLNSFYEDISDENIIKLAYDPNYKLLNNGSNQDNLVAQYRTFNPIFFSSLKNCNKDALKTIYQSFKANNCDIKNLPINHQETLEILQKFIMPDEYKLAGTDLFSILFHDSQAVNKLESYLNDLPEQETTILGVGQATEG